MWILISWLLPIMATALIVFGIVFFCSGKGLESEMFISIAIIYVIWAIIVTCRSVFWVYKKISEMSHHE